MIIVLDTGALLSKYYLYLPKGSSLIVTTSDNFAEVRDEENRAALEGAIEAGLVHLIDPDSGSISEVKEVAKSIGELGELSAADLKLAALALYMKRRGGKVVVITDDYNLQNLLLHLSIGFKPLRTRGIREARKYEVRCPICGYSPGEPGEDYCPFCNAKLRRRAS